MTQHDENRDGLLHRSAVNKADVSCASHRQKIYPYKVTLFPIFPFAMAGRN